MDIWEPRGARRRHTKVRSVIPGNPAIIGHPASPVRSLALRPRLSVSLPFSVTRIIGPRGTGLQVTTNKLRI